MGVDVSSLIAGLETQLIIGGRSTPASDGSRQEIFDPSTARPLVEVAMAADDDVHRAVESARSAQRVWWGCTPVERSSALRRMGDLIKRDQERLAAVESLDTGKPLSQARSDVDVAAQYFTFYAGIADKVYGSTIPLSELDFASTFREPLGVTGHIVPWNYPIQISSRTIAPSLAGGNAVVLKPAEEAPLTALLLGRLALEAGFPDGLVNVIPGLGSVAGAALSRHADIDLLSFTGGEFAGKLVMQALAQNLKPSTMELGGKSPNIVFEDADLDRAVPVICRSLIQNSGQTCSAGSRLIVADALHDELVERLSAALRSVRLGEGLSDPDMGPLISERQHSSVLAAITSAISEGAVVAAGGPSDERPGGWFVRPTLLHGVSASMSIAQNEVFGPVLSVIRVSDEDEAIAVANGTEFGLIAAVWTSSIDRALRVSRRLECGQVYVNSYGAGGGVALPFGGVKKSGFGREKGIEAISMFTQTKTVVFNIQPSD